MRVIDCAPRLARTPKVIASTRKEALIRGRTFECLESVTTAFAKLTPHGPVLPPVGRSLPRLSRLQRVPILFERDLERLLAKRIISFRRCCVKPWTGFSNISTDQTETQLDPTVQFGTCSARRTARQSRQWRFLRSCSWASAGRAPNDIEFIYAFSACQQQFSSRPYSLAKGIA